MTVAQCRMHVSSDGNLSPATATLGDGNDVRAGSLAGAHAGNCAAQLLMPA